MGKDCSRQSFCISTMAQASFSTFGLTFSMVVMQDDYRDIGVRIASGTAIEVRAQMIAESPLILFISEAITVFVLGKLLHIFNNITFIDNFASK